MFTIALDFETRSEVDLKARGVDIYASDPSTDIICCSFINKGNGQKWLWFAGYMVPAELKLALSLAENIEAHNARFDQLIYEYIAVDDYGFPVLKKVKWVCTAAQCRVNALPSNLDSAARASNAKYKKDRTGSQLIKKLSIPDKKTGQFNKSPADIVKMGDYCMRDSEAMVSTVSTLRPLSEADKRDWQVNERINDRGILVDIEMAELAQKYAAEEKQELGRDLSKLTVGVITAVTQTKRLLTILVEAFSNKESTKLLRCITKSQKDLNAPVKYTLDKAARSQLLECTALPAKFRKVVELIDQGGNSSVAKFTSMLNRADPVTNRVHGAFIFAGAGQTQRYSSKGLQLHNMRRDCFSAELAEKLKDYMRQGMDITEHSKLTVMDTLARLLRPTIIPAEGHTFVVGDWSAIEARVLPWLTNSEGGEEALQVFRDGIDVYVNTAVRMTLLSSTVVAGMTKKELSKLPERQIGKVANLSLGFGGAVGAFQAMAKNYGLELDDTFVLGAVMAWREANPWAGKFWRQLEVASVNAVRNPCKEYVAGRVRFIFIPNVLGGTLMCVLPNNTVIQYPYAKIERGGVTAMKASVQPKADSSDAWPRMSLWGGFLAENVTQATAACLLREALAELVKLDFPVVGHVHDEIILEAKDEEVESSVYWLQAIMEACPEWAEGLPLDAEPAVMKRYGK